MLSNHQRKLCTETNYSRKESNPTIKQFIKMLRKIILSFSINIWNRMLGSNSFCKKKTTLNRNRFPTSKLQLSPK